MSIRRNIKLYDSASAGTGSWIALDTRYDEDPTSRPLRIVVASGDTLTLQGIVKDVKGIDKSFLDSLLTEEISTLAEYTESQVDVLDGNWTYLRVIKAGTAGKGIIEGFI